MEIEDNRRIWLLSLFAMLLLAGCTALPKRLPSDASLAYVVSDNGRLASQHAPVFVVEDSDDEYNRIGTPRARLDKDGKVQVFVDLKVPTIYRQRRVFQTLKASYTNLIHRIHFEKVPFSLFPFHIGMGRNVGLIIIVTLNDVGQPLLFTTVHSCGCYLAFIPTSFLDKASFPDNWGAGRQSVYLESLPRLLDYQGISHDHLKVMIEIRAGSHRVKNLWLADQGALTEYKRIEAKKQPLDALEALYLKSRSITSFYEENGPRRDYVKGGFKPWERLSMSWWALDWRVGEDKRLGQDKNDGIVFYTSLKPWARQASDMRDFVGFLKYWGWKF